MKSISVFVATHKAFDMPAVEALYKPIQGGAELYPEQRFGYLLDNDGDNISLKKEQYNELSSLYWAWKNDKSDIKGLCHYRRFLSKGGKIGKTILSGDDIEMYLNRFDVLLPYPIMHKGHSNRQYMLDSGNVFEQDIQTLRDVVSEIAPDYLKSFDEVMSMEYACYCNMVIAGREVFDAYADWLFPILETVESRIDLSERNPAQIRIYGYLGELLLNIYFRHNQYKIKYCYSDVLREYTPIEKFKLALKRGKLYWFIYYRRIACSHRL